MMKILNVFFLSVLIIPSLCYANQELIDDLKILANSKEQKENVFIFYKKIIRKYEHLKVREWHEAYTYALIETILAKRFGNIDATTSFINKLFAALKNGLDS